MNKNTFARVSILIAVFAVAALIIYPKLTASNIEPQADTGSSASRSTSNEESPAASTPAKQSYGETALAEALKSGKPTMLLFHSNT